MNNSNLMSLVLTEEFSIDPITNIDPMDYFPEEFETSIIQIYSEATEPVAKNKVMERIIGVIKAIGKWIVRAVNSIIKFIANIFAKKTLTADQVLKRLGVSEKNATDDLRVNIPSSEESTFNINSDFNVIAKPLDIEMDKEGSMIITPKKSVLAQIFRNNQGKIRAQNGLFLAANGNHMAVFNALKYPECQDLMIKIAEGIKDRTSRDQRQNMFNLDRLLGQEDGSGSYKFTIKEFRNFNGTIAKCVDIISGVSDDVSPTGLNENLFVINQFSNVIAGLQFGINVITSCMKNIYVIDRSYVESISDADILSKFVGTLIDANIPGKYIAMNTWLISTKDIKGDADAFKPVWGQTRVVFFPPNKSIVHKVAYNPYGVMSNKTEVNVSKAFVNGGDGNVIAKVEHSTDNGVIIDVERVSGKTPNMKQLDSFIFKFRHICSKYHIIINDLHLQNVKVTPSGMKAIDYGMIVKTF